MWKDKGILLKQACALLNGLYWLLEQLQPYVLLVIEARCSTQLSMFNIAIEISIKLCYQIILFLVKSN